MNPDELQHLWNSPDNAPSPGRQEKLAGQFVRQMRRRRRFQAAWLINTTLLMSVVTVLAFRAIALGRVNLEREWSLLPLLIAPWAFVFHFIRRFFQSGRTTETGGRTVVESLRAAEQSLRSELTNLRRVAILFVIMVPLLALSMRQIWAAGKIERDELASMAVLFGGVLLAGAGGITFRYFARLRPQRRRILDLLADPAR